MSTFLKHGGKQARIYDHAAYQGVYVGLIVDLNEDADGISLATVARREPGTNKMRETIFKLANLVRADPRR